MATVGERRKASRRGREITGLLSMSGPERRAALDRANAAASEAVSYYIPPALRPLVGLLTEANPVRGMERAAQASIRMDDPGLTPLQRLGNFAEMGTEVAGIAGPAAIANRVGMAPVQAVTEGLLGYGMGTAPGQAADALAYRLGQPSELAADTLYANPVPLWGGTESLAKDTDRLHRAVDAVPELEGVLPYLRPAEASAVTPRNAGSVVRASQATSVDDLLGAAQAGQGKIGWYRDSSNALQAIFGEDTPRFTALLSAFSPQTSVEMNLMNATRIWENWVRAGRPKDPTEIRRIFGQSVVGDKGDASVLPAWVNNGIRALSAPEGAGIDAFTLSGPKVDNFRLATGGDLDAYTNDAWMANLTGVPQDAFAKRGDRLPGYGPGYLGASASGRQAAEQASLLSGVDIAPSEIQESTWSFAKALMEQAAEARGELGPRAARDIYSQGLLSEGRIQDVPDFAGLLNQEVYGEPLRRVGYGSAIDEAARAPRTTGGRPLDGLGASAANVARRIDDLYGHRQFVSSTAPFRPGPGTGGQPPRQAYAPVGGGRGRHVPLSFGGKGTLLQPSAEFQATAERLHTAAPPLYRLASDGPSRRAFVSRMQQAQQSRGILGRRSADVYTPNQYRGYKLFTTEDGASGFGISPKGELVSVLSTAGQTTSGFSDAALVAGVQNGARWLNAFDTVLPQKYARFGFQPVARIPFDEAFARMEWGDADVDAFMDKLKAYNGGKPDLVFMAYKPTANNTVANRFGGTLMDDWDSAEAAVQKAAGVD